MELKCGRRSFAACGRRVTLPAAARRRKVHSTPFPPGGENCARSLAPPLPGEPTSLGFAWRYERDYPKRHRGRGRWTLRAHRTAFPGPHYGGRVSVRFCNISGAQNLSSSLNSCRATGPWVCKNCRWCGSTSAPGFAEQVFAGPLSAGRSGTGPYIKNRRLPDLP